MEGSYEKYFILNRIYDLDLSLHHEDNSSLTVSLLLHGIGLTS